MTHQCLNCGHIIPKGSDEILRGCTECGGKKFMFVSSPLSKERREALVRKADQVREQMARKADANLLRILRERGVTELDGSTLTLESGASGEWVRVTPKELSIPAPAGPVGPAPIPPPTPPAEPVRTVPEEPRKPSAKEIIFEFDLARKREMEATAPSKPSPPAPKKKPKAKKGLSKKRVVKKPSKGAPAKRKAPGERPVDVITIVEHGVYEIDVKRLLEDNPLIIQKDGSYLIHLPSLFKEGKKQKK